MYESGRGIKFINHNIRLQTLYFYGNSLTSLPLSVQKNEDLPEEGSRGNQTIVIIRL